MSTTLTQITRETKSPESFDALLQEIKGLAADATAENPLTLEIVLQDNRYSLKKPLVFSAKEVPGLAYTQITLRGVEGKAPVICGNEYFYNDTFEAVEGKPYYKYQMPQNEDGTYPLFREMYVDGKRVPLATSPEMVHPFQTPPPEKREEKDYLHGMFMPIEAVKTLASEDIAAAELHGYFEWTHKVFRIKGVDLSTTREHNGQLYALVELKEEYESYARNPGGLIGMANRECFFRNSVAFLTPGTFAYDWQKGIVYFYPMEGYDILHHTHEYPTLENLIICEGMSNFTLESLSFTGATTSIPYLKGYNTGQANMLNATAFPETLCGRLPNAAVLTNEARNFTVRGCSFTGLGGNGIMMVNKTVGVCIEDCHFEDVGMSAATIGNARSSVTAWDDPANRTVNVTFTNNYLRHIGYEYPASCAFYISLVDVLNFTHNTVIDVPYSALSAGWNWVQVPYLYGEKVNVRDAEIAYNYFEDYMMLLRDGGATYVNGGNCHVSCDKLFNRIHDNYSVCHSMRSRARYGYYMDGAASNWDCYHNVMINANYPIFVQPHPQALSCHCHVRDTYSNTPYEWYFGDKSAFASRNVLVEGFYMEAKTEEEMLALYPEARAILANAGCKR